MQEEVEILQEGGEGDPPQVKPKFNPKAKYEPVKEDKPKFDPSKPFQKKKDLQTGGGVGASEVPSEIPSTENKKRIKPLSDFDIIRQRDDKTFGQVIRNTNNKAVSETNYMQKPVSELDVEEGKRKKELHEKDIEIAIDNTAERALRQRGIPAQKGSVLYNLERQKVKNAYDKGDAVFHKIVDKKTGQETIGLDRTPGWWEDLTHGWNTAMKGNEDAHNFNNNMSDAGRVEFLKKEQKDKPQEGGYIGQTSGAAGFIGENAPFLGKAAIGTAAGAALTLAAPESAGASLAGLPAVTAYAMTVPDMVNQGAYNETVRRYQIIREHHPEISEVDAMAQARRGGQLSGGVVGALENAAFMAPGSHALAQPLSNDIKNVAGRFIKSNLKAAGKMGAITAAGTAGEQLEGNAEGIKTPTSEIINNSVQSFKDNATVGSLLHGVTSAVMGAVNLPKTVISSFKYGLKDVDPNVIRENLEVNEKAGIIPEGTTEKVVKDIEDYKTALGKTAGGLTPESESSIAGLIQSKDKIVEEMKTKDASQHEVYKKRIEAIDNQIADIQRTNKPLQHEIDETGNTLEKPTFDDVAKNRVEDLADKISKGKRIEDIVDVQTQEKFPEEVDKALNKILREEKAKNKDSEKPNNDITNAIEKYFSQKEKSKGNPEEISQPIELSIEPKEVKNEQVQENEIHQPKEVEVAPIAEPNKVIEPAAEAESAPPKPPTEEPPVAEGKEEGLGITHAKTEELRTEHKLGDYQKEVETVEKWRNEATERLQKGELPDLLKRMEEGKPVSDVEQMMMGQHIANLNEKVSTNPSVENITALRNAVELSDKAGGSAWGRSGRARQETFLPDDSLGSYFMEEMDVNKNAPLTENQKKTVEKEHSEITEAQKKYEDKIASLESENARLKADKAVKKATSDIPKAKRTHDDYVVERKKISESISEKLKKARGELNATPIPYAKELFAIAPDVAKLVKSYVEEGVSKLEDIVTKIHNDLKSEIPDLKENDIQDIIAGKYNTKKPTRNDLAKKLYELRQEAKLIDAYEKLKNGIEPKSEKEKIKRNQEIEKLSKQIKEHDLTKLSSYKTIAKSEISKLEEDIKNGNFSNEKESDPVKLDKEAKELQDNLIKLRNERKKRLLEQEYDNSSKWNKFQVNAANALSIPRTLMASVDYSAPLRQALLPTIAHPQMAAKAGLEMFKASFSQKQYDRWFNNLENSPRYDLIKESGLGITDVNNPKLAAKEEQFMNGIAEKIPIVGRLVKGSERAYTIYLNKMRVDLFNRFADEMQKQGKTFENSENQYKEMAAFVNNMTGRGDMGKTLNESAPILNSLFFSPRLAASRINTLTYLAQPRFWNKTPVEVRKDYFRSLVSTAAVGLTILGLAKAAGADTESDPRSPDFGKIKSGNTRWDIWGGHQQYIRLISQMITGKRKSSTSGNITEIGTSNPYSGTRGGLAMGFLRSKLSPVPSLAVDILTGSNSVGDKLTTNWKSKEGEIGIGENLRNHLLPLMLTGLRDAIKEDGAKALLTTGIPSTFGVGVQSYEPKDTATSWTEEDKKNPVLKNLIDKEIKIPSYDPAKVQTKEVNGKVVEHLSDYDETIQKLYKGTADKYLREEIMKLKSGKIKIYVDEDGTASTPTSEAGKKGKKRVSFDQLTKDQLQNIISGGGGLTSEVTEKVKKEVLKGKTPKPKTE